MSRVYHMRSHQDFNDTGLLPLLHGELVLVLAVQIHDLLRQSRCLHLLLKVIQRTQKHVIITWDNEQSATSFNHVSKRQNKGQAKQTYS
jgi:uncharacterized protein YrrD